LQARLTSEVGQIDYMYASLVPRDPWTVKKCTGLVPKLRFAI